MAGNHGNRVCFTAVNPKEKGFLSITVSDSRVKFITRLGLGHTKEMIHLVGKALEFPAAVFEGIRQENDQNKYGKGDGWMCFCFVPTERFLPDGRSENPKPLMVFLVFVDEDLFAYNWRWEKADLNDLSLPVGWKERFVRRLR